MLFIGNFVETRLNLEFFTQGTLWTLCNARIQSLYDDMPDREPFATLESSLGQYNTLIQCQWSHLTSPVALVGQSARLANG
jgi:hypothetical protein